MEELLKALRTIKEECEKNTSCDECTLRLEKVAGAPTCGIMNRVPANWEMNTPGWKAFAR